MKRHTIFENLPTWQNKALTLTDCNRITNHIIDDLEKRNISSEVLHGLYLLTCVGKKFKSGEIPDNIVTMNSKLIIQHDSNSEECIRITYPEDINEPGDKSVYSALAFACLGESENSTIDYFDGKQHRKCVIKQIQFQPEREKLFYL